MTKKRKIIYITIAAAIVIIAALAIIFMPKTAPQTVTEMLSTAQKYLVEMDYERAIAEFNKVIELDPMNADAYLGLAEAYEKSGDIDKAVETLEKGFELTGDERLQARIAMLNGENTAGLIEPEEVKYVNVQGYEIPTNITSLMLIGSDTEGPNNVKWSYPLKTDESKYEYKLNEPLTDISFLGDFTKLQSLNLSLNNISDISALSGLTNLMDLSLWGNQISDIRALSGLTSLRYLGLNDIQNSDITALSGLTNLKSLDLDGNQISDISALSGLMNLTDLRLRWNQISDISTLSGLTNLTKLDLSYNQISDLSALSGLTNLTSLDLGNNQISNISALSELKNLTYLSLWGNQISDISVLSGLTNIEILYLNNNPISESDIEALKSALPNCEIRY